ncbi:hypothetical protein [Gilvimarinus japonicus]|uniref:Exostosin GT47 domain-containing protein n=1 Tax=Gilvimarinus japonicus TaxID=1796469 RepID=A0ABV7HP06_9GAMM
MKKTSIHMHNTRLFPKNLGAAAYKLTGIAAQCDWAIMSDQKTGDFYVHGDLSRSPRTVFLSMRGFFASIPYFYENILPKIESQFILITGSEDLTIPNQIDKRWRAFRPDEKETIYRILEDHRLVHWFAENRDTVLPRMSTLPIGYVFSGPQSHSAAIESRPCVPIEDRPLRALCSHRVRPGPQWETRRQVTNLSMTKFSELVTIVNQEVSETKFLNLIEEHAFVLCVQGGGIDPSPKAWTAIAHGSIPIIASSPLDDAYSQLPVAFVNGWDEHSLSEKKLREWIQRLAPYYDNPEMRLKVVEKLQLDYWWKQITNTYPKSY